MNARVYAMLWISAGTDKVTWVDNAPLKKMLVSGLVEAHFYWG